MKKNTFSSTKTLESGWSLFLCVAAMALAMFVTPDTAQSTDKLIVTDPTGATAEFAAADNGTIRLNSNTLPATVPSWSLIYGSSNSSNAGYVMDSYGSPSLGAGNVTLGGGGAFRFAEGTQAAPKAVYYKDRLGFFVFSGYDGTEFVNSVGLVAKVDQAVSTNYVPADFVFETIAQPEVCTPTCTNTPEVPDDGLRVERIKITSSGLVGIGGSGSAGTGIPNVGYPLQMGSGAYVSFGGVWTNASSRAYKENIKTLTGEEANQALDGLSPVKFNYKTDKEDRHVGFIAEDVPDLVATKDRKGLSPMDIVAVLTRVVQEQKNTISEQTNKLSEQTNMISALSKRLDAMQQEINREKGMNIVGSLGESIK